MLIADDVLFCFVFPNGMERAGGKLGFSFGRPRLIATVPSWLAVASSFPAERSDPFSALSCLQHNLKN